MNSVAAASVLGLVTAVGAAMGAASGDPTRSGKGDLLGFACAACAEGIGHVVALSEDASGEDAGITTLERGPAVPRAVTVAKR